MTHPIKSLFIALALGVTLSTAMSQAQTSQESEQDMAGAPASKPPAETPPKDHSGHDHAGHDHSKHQPVNPRDLPEMDHIFTEAPDDHVIGAADAPVTIIGYASVTCPHCGQWFTSEWPKLKTEHIDKGHVRFVMREYPTQPQMLARAGFAIINCAPEDEYFTHLIHQMHSQEQVFQALRERKAQQVYEGFAMKAGLATPQALHQCLNDRNIQARIDRSILRAHAGSLTGVPNFIINGEFFDGDISAKGLSAQINAILSGGVSAIAPESTVDEELTPYEGKP